MKKIMLAIVLSFVSVFAIAQDYDGVYETDVYGFTLGVNTFDEVTQMLASQGIVFSVTATERPIIQVLNSELFASEGRVDNAYLFFNKDQVLTRLNVNWMFDNSAHEPTHFYTDLVDYLGGFYEEYVMSYSNDFKWDEHANFLNVKDENSRLDIQVTKRQESEGARVGMEYLYITNR